MGPTIGPNFGIHYCKWLKESVEKKRENYLKLGKATKRRGREGRRKWGLYECLCDIASYVLERPAVISWIQLLELGEVSG